MANEDGMKNDSITVVGRWRKQPPILTDIHLNYRDKVTHLQNHKTVANVPPFVRKTMRECNLDITWEDCTAYRTRRHTSANTDTRRTQMAVSSKIGGRGALRRTENEGDSESDTGVSGLTTWLCDRVARSNWTGAVAAVGGNGVDEREGVAGIMIEEASIGRTGLGAIRGGENVVGIGRAGAGGSAVVVTVAASKTLITLSAIPS